MTSGYCTLNTPWNTTHIHVMGGTIIPVQKVITFNVKLTPPYCYLFIHSIQFNSIPPHLIISAGENSN